MPDRQFDLTTLGELQLRLTVLHGQRLAGAETLRVSSACSEANVAATLAQLGLRTQVASVTAAGTLGDRALREFRSAGVDTTNVLRPEHGRVPLYFYEPAEHPSPAEVYFDRESTPFRTAAPSEFDWASLLNTRMFFTTGITAALTESTGDLVRHAISAAHASDVTTAFDMNYRQKLWSPERAQQLMTDLNGQLDVLFCSHRDAELLFGLRCAPHEAPRLLHESHGVPLVVSTAGTAGCWAYADGRTERADVTATRVVDRPGAGDAFVAGFLYGHLSGTEVGTSLRYGVAAARISLSHHGDVVPLSVADLTRRLGDEILR